jgi:hypothetical protein
MDDDSVVKLDEQSSVSIGQLSNNRLSVNVLSGGVSVHAATQRAGGTFEVRAGNSALAVRGTSFVFENDENDEINIHMLTGSGEVNGTYLGAGQSLTVHGSNNDGEKNQTVGDLVIDENLSLFTLNEIKNSGLELSEEQVSTIDSLIEQKEEERELQERSQEDALLDARTPPPSEPSPAPAPPPSYQTSGGGSGFGYNDLPLIPTDPEVIYSAVINIAAPVKGAVPQTTAAIRDEGRFGMGTVSWYPPMPNGVFEGNTVYTATVMLVPYTGYIFCEYLYVIFGNAVETAVTRGAGRTLMLTAEFAATLDITVTDIAIAEQPYNLEYLHGDQLDLYGLEVELAFVDDDGMRDALFLYPDEFVEFGITTNPANYGMLLRRFDDGRGVTVSHGSHSAVTDPLTIGRAEPVIELPPTASNVVIGSPLSTSVLSGDTMVFGAVSLIQGTWEWYDPTVTVNVSGSHIVVFTPSYPYSEDYTETMDYIYVIAASSAGGSDAAYRTQVQNAAAQAQIVFDGLETADSANQVPFGFPWIDSADTVQLSGAIAAANALLLQPSVTQAEAASVTDDLRAAVEFTENSMSSGTANAYVTVNGVRQSPAYTNFDNVRAAAVTARANNAAAVPVFIVWHHGGDTFSGNINLENISLTIWGGLTGSPELTFAGGELRVRELTNHGVFMAIGGRLNISGGTFANNQDAYFELGGADAVIDFTGATVINNGGAFVLSHGRLEGSPASFTNGAGGQVEVVGGVTTLPAPTQPPFTPLPTQLNITGTGGGNSTIRLDSDLVDTMSLLRIIFDRDTFCQSSFSNNIMLEGTYTWVPHLINNSHVWRNQNFNGNTNRNPLAAAITAAEQTKINYPDSADGSDIHPNRRWVSSSDPQSIAFNEAIENAREILYIFNPSQSDINAAVTALDTAQTPYISNFNANSQQGTAIFVFDNDIFKASSNIGDLINATTSVTVLGAEYINSPMTNIIGGHLYNNSIELVIGSSEASFTVLDPMNFYRIENYGFFGSVAEINGMSNNAARGVEIINRGIMDFGAPVYTHGANITNTENSTINFSGLHAYGSNITNSGTIDFRDSLYLRNDSFSTASADISNSPLGTINYRVGNSNFAGARLSNQGRFNFRQDIGNHNFSGAVLTNSGAMYLQEGQLAGLTNAIENSGLLVISNDFISNPSPFSISGTAGGINSAAVVAMYDLLCDFNTPRAIVSPANFDDGSGNVPAGHVPEGTYVWNGSRWVQSDVAFIGAASYRTVAEAFEAAVNVHGGGVTVDVRRSAFYGGSSVPVNNPADAAGMDIRLEISNPAALILDDDVHVTSLDISNSGTLVIKRHVEFSIVPSPSTVLDSVNRGTIDIEAFGRFRNQVPFSNTGGRIILRQGDGGEALVINAAFTNTGHIDIGSDTEVLITAPFTNDGNINVYGTLGNIDMFINSGIITMRKYSRFIQQGSGSLTSSHVIGIESGSTFYQGSTPVPLISNTGAFILSPAGGYGTIFILSPVRGNEGILDFALFTLNGAPVTGTTLPIGAYIWNGTVFAG